MNGSTAHALQARGANLVYRCGKTSILRQPRATWSSDSILHRASKSFHSAVIDGSHNRYWLIEKDGQVAAAVFCKAH
jgi:hypothetical protein